MLELRQIAKTYHTGDEDIRALKDINLTFDKPQFVAVLGPSGCGKTTLLNILGGLARYDEGDLIINNQSTKSFKDVDWDSYRNHQIGFIFQSYNLINHLTALGNVELALSLSGESLLVRRKKAREALIRVGLGDKLNKNPNQLSNGQIQRVAIARALVNNPKIILADEPTGALDSENSIQIMELLKEMAKDKLVVMVTHNQELAEQYSDRIINLLDGEITSDEVKTERTETDFALKPFDKKTYMGFGTALKLSFFNLLKKLGKTLVSSFAGGIGIIGVGLVIGISIGFSNYVDIVQLTTNTNTPLVIQNKTVTEAFPDPDNPAVPRPKTFPKNQNYITSQQTSPPRIYEEVVNLITPEYLNYLEDMDQSLYHEIKPYYDLNFPTFLRKDDDGNIFTVNYSASSTADIGEIPYEKPEYLGQMFDVLSGRLPSNTVSSNRIAEGVLIISDRNQLPDTMLNRLGLDGNDYEAQISFSRLLNMEIRIAHSGVIYEENPDTELYIKRSNADIYDDEDIITLKIVGILRRKQNAAIPQYQGMRYTSGVNRFILNETINAPVVLRQQAIIDDYYENDERLYSILNNKVLTEKEATTLLRNLGIAQEPSRLIIYHKDEETREEIIAYLDAFNEGRDNQDKIFINQSVLTETWLVDNTLSAINVVLVWVAFIALFISISLLSILTYLSVIQRTPEIGILRSIGARKKDISRVFNAEAFIVGILSSIVGLLLLYLVVPVFNTVFESTLRTQELINIDPKFAFLLLGGNILLTLIIGFIPAIVASKKDPIDALRSVA
ncbi:MAG: ABC transporter ATP-binding protein/permease [Acholeplasmataceae bacterium]|nr:ABC transporter ATP-binding protein/permease [Acholeplasmataceae bacterium]